MIKLIRLDYPKEYGGGYQDMGTVKMIERGELYGWLISLGIFLGIIIVLYIEEIRREDSSNTGIRLEEGIILENYYVSCPIIMLYGIGYPSIELMNIWNKIEGSSIGLKVIGYQWYWWYNVILEGELINTEIVSYTERLGKIGWTIEVDRGLELPIGELIRVYITGGDVIHSLSCNSLGIKMDSIPGKVNIDNMKILRNSEYIGGCMEGCGTYHYEMSIVIRGINIRDWICLG